ncbi:MAG TPA: porin family protein [Chitinophagaceae bacterium]|nr:porin family protein [Chitinophagaceae bacterium]
MKKFLLLSATLFISFAGFAQTTTKYGFTLGGNLTQISGKGIDNKSSLGFIAGVFARVPLTDKWNVQPELLFNYANAQKGTDFLEVYNDNGYQNARTAIGLSYISLPVLFDYKLTKLVTINAGPEYDFLVDDNEDLVANGNRAFKLNNLGISGGAELNLGGFRFFANYVYGLTNINDIDSRYKWYQRQALIGLNFNIM